MSAARVDLPASLAKARLLVLAPDGEFAAQIARSLETLGAHAWMRVPTLHATKNLLRRCEFDVIIAEVGSDFTDGLRLPGTLQASGGRHAKPMPHILWTGRSINADAAGSRPVDAAANLPYRPGTPLSVLQSLGRLARTAGIEVSIAMDAGPAALQTGLFQLLPRPHHEPPKQPAAGGSEPTEDDVISALTSGEGLRVVFQPQVDLRDKTIVGAEALVRWHHPRLGCIAPCRLLPVVHRLGLDLLLFSFMERRVIEMLSVLDTVGLAIPLAVNASPHTICAPGLAERLALQMEQCGLPPQRLTLELTEETLDFDILDLSASITALRARGFQVSLDDFGAGSATLALLSQVHFDEIKIDGALVRSSLADPKPGRILSGIVDLARAFGMRAVAEGIEDIFTIFALSALGCEVGQGYALGRPMEAVDFLRHALHENSRTATN